MTNFERVHRAKARHEHDLIGIPGVVAIGIGQDTGGEPVIELYAEHNAAETRCGIAEAIENVQVRIVETGRFEAR